MSTLPSMHITCPSGLAANLFASTASLVGIGQTDFDNLVDTLGLTKGLKVVWDGNICDGLCTCDASSPLNGTPDDMVDQILQVKAPWSPLAAQIIIQRFQFDQVIKHAYATDWCDTLFDACAAALILQEVNDLTIHGTIPTTTADHPVSKELLKDWVWEFDDCGVEIMTPSASAVLTACDAQQVFDPSPPSQLSLRGRFAVKYNLAAVDVAVI